MRWLFISIVVAQTALAQQTPIVLKTSRLLDGRGKVVTNARVVVTDGKIASVGGATPKGAVTYDLSRYTVLPGLIDGHDHVGWHFNKNNRFHSNGDGETPTDEAIAAAGNAYTTLVAGWTTIA